MNNLPSGQSVSPEAISSKLANTQNKNKDSINDVIITINEKINFIDKKDGTEKYEAFVNSYNYEREHGGINGMKPAGKFMKCLKPRILLH
jgi:hypothetical protein